jgi:N-acylneuraminate cytidylyltransferase
VSRVAAVIPARGGSRGIPHKNLVPLCGRPLVAWSILQARAAHEIHEVWVSSDSPEILETAERFGALPILRPAAMATDDTPSEAAWLHALDAMERSGSPVELLVGMQATSPIREASDLDEAVRTVRRDGLDSLLSCCELQDYFIWRRGQEGPTGVNQDYHQRQRRQAIEARYLENGSFYVFTPQLLREQHNRLGGRIGLYVMAKHKQFQIDEPGDVALCEAIMRGYGMDRSP